MPRPRLLALVASLLFVSVAFGCGGSTPCDPGPCGGSNGTGGSGGGNNGTGGSGGGTFLCKGLTCTRGQQACTVTSQMSQNDMGECTPLPVVCQVPDADCSCFGDLMGCVCQKQVTGDFVIFCDVTN